MNFYSSSPAPSSFCLNYSDRIVYNRLQTVEAQIPMTPINRWNILAPRMAMEVMGNVRLVESLLQ
jgi:hypothetical protein